jgi:hypothetical protein
MWWSSLASTSHANVDDAMSTIMRALVTIRTRNGEPGIPPENSLRVAGVGPPTYYHTKN